MKNDVHLLPRDRIPMQIYEQILISANDLMIFFSKTLKKALEDTPVSIKG